jgi:hypothetical protein
MPSDPIRPRTRLEAASRVPDRPRAGSIGGVRLGGGCRPGLLAGARRLSDAALDTLMLAGTLLFGAAFTLFLLFLVEVVPPLLLGPEFGS